MPWKIQSGGADCPYEVVKEDTGARVACHSDEASAKKHMAALYANEPEAREREPLPEVENRTAEIRDVDTQERIVTVVAVPYETPAVVPYRGEAWQEMVMRGSFDGIETTRNEVRRNVTVVNRDHDKQRLVGKIVSYFPKDEKGLVVDAYISSTELGDETLQLARDGILSGSVGMRVWGKDQMLDRRAKTRFIKRAFLDHLALTSDPAYPDAQVIGVRDPENAAEAQLPRLITPNLDEFLHDPIFQWAQDRVRAVEQRASGDSSKPYGDVTYADPGYKADNQKRYPIDTEAHARAALSYFSMPKNHEGYTAEQIASIMGRIRAACKRFGIEMAAQK